MVQKRNTSGLKRGGVSDEARQKGLAKAREVNLEKNRILAAAAENPYAGYDEMHKTMTRHILMLLKGESRDGTKPQREVTERLREYRQLTSELNTYLQTKGADEEANAFFALVDRHLETANFYEASPDGPPVEAAADA